MKFFVLIFTLALSWQVSARGKVKYPSVQYVQGQVFKIDRIVTVVKKEPKVSEKRTRLKKGSLLKEHAVLETSKDSELRLMLSPDATLVLKESTLVQIPAISWKDGAVESIVLRRGVVRYLCQEIKKEKCERTLKTDLYEVKPATGDYLLQYAPRIPEVQMAVLKGEVPFGGIENERIVTLHAGEKASFKGELENDVPAFDVLLEGRRVAKGKASEIQKIAESDLRKYQKEEATDQKKIKAPPKSKRLPDQICDKPWGKFNQCAWICEKNAKKAKVCQVQRGAQCVRMRCNADGQWVDRYELLKSQSKCRAQPVVSACDY